MISLVNLTMRFGAKILFSRVNLQFTPGNRYGLVGANGSGKSTLIKLLTDEASPEDGEILRPIQTKIGTLTQDHYRYEEDLILDIVLQGKKNLFAAIQNQNTLLQKENLTSSECEELAELTAWIDKEGGNAAKSEAAKLLEGLGIKKEWHNRPLKLLSGGYKLRVLLAQVFFSHPDILVLDEPTNHLDLYSIRWLEGYLIQYPGLLIVSSHDRDFLNRVCNYIADIDYGTITIFKGNYDQFLTLKKQNLIQRETLLEKQEKKRADLQTFVDRFKAKASKARQAQSKAKLAEKLEEEMDEINLMPSSRIYPKLSFPIEKPSGIIVCKAEGIEKAFDHKKILAHVSFEIERGDKIAIVGPNGVGKSTLLEILTGFIPKDQGSYSWGHGVKFSYFPQDHKREAQGSLSLLDWLRNAYPTVHQETLRNMLGRVLFDGDKALQPICSLSGGEMARLILAKMMISQSNVLIFDEPTNHLDIEAIDELSNALQNYEGTLVIVSHNRHFVSKIATKIIEVSKQGVRKHHCSYTEYLEKQETDHLSAQSPLKNRYEKIDKEHSQGYSDHKKQKILKSQLKKKIEKTEETCDHLEQQVKAIDEKLSSDGFYQNHSQEVITSLIQQKNTLETQLLEMLEKWEKWHLELSECK